VLKTVIEAAQDKKAVVNDFLVKQFLLQDIYREQQEKNFDDKIFFFEPCNKYCDLVWIRKAVFGLLVQNADLLDQEELKKHVKTEEESKQSDELVALTEPVLAFETRSKAHMLKLLSGADCPKESESGFLVSMTELYNSLQKKI
jgi:hypothetical protein